MHPGLRTITAVLALAVTVGADQVADSDVLAMFAPSRRVAIEAGRPVVELVPVAHVDVALVGAVRTTIDDERLVAWYREVEQLQRGKYIPVIRRFSNPPTIEDLAELELDDEELEDLPDCRPGHCDIKLAAPEMRHISMAIKLAGRDWKPAAQAAFRQVILARARAHAANGFAGAPPYEDHHRPAVPVAELERLFNGSQIPGLCMLPVFEHLRRYPADRESVESFLFWSKDTLGDLKPIVGITQVSIVRARQPGEPTLIASSQVYATHYLTASLSVTAVTRTPDGAASYLVYARRSRTDLFTGAFGGWLRRIAHKRVRAEGPGVLEGLRRRMEAGPPAVVQTSSKGGIQ